MGPATNATSTVAAGAQPTAIAVNTSTNHIYVSNTNDDNVMVIDGLSNSVSTVHTGSAPIALVVNPVTNRIYAANETSANVTVIEEQAVQPVPLTTAITALPGDQTSDRNQAFTFTSNSTYSPFTPTPLHVYYQVDTWQGTWQKANGSHPSFAGAVFGLPLGTHVLYAYASDGQDATIAMANANIGAIAAYVFTVVPAPTSTTVVADTNPISPGNPVTLTATVTPNPGTGTPTGTVQFQDGGGNLGAPVAVDSNGQAAYQTSALGIGSHNIAAIYSGDLNFSNSSAVLVLGVKANQTITFGSLANHAYGDPAFAVSASSSSGLPVTFSIASGPATISGNTVTITGTGTVTVRASQAGDSNYNPAPNVDQSFAVSGNAVLTFNPPTRSFGYVALNKSSNGTITVSNTGNAPVSITGLATTGDFAQTNNCPATLNPSSSCIATMIFTPTAIGLRTGTLAVHATTGTATMNISGGGVALGVTPTTFEFGNVLITSASAVKTVTFTNYSNVAVAFNSITPSTPEITSTDNCRPWLAALASCNVNLTYRPTNIVNKQLYTVSVNTSDFSSPVIGGHGTGYALAISPTALSFYSVLVNTDSAPQSVSITNKASTSVTLNSIAPNDSNLILSHNCPATLASNQSCTATVKLHPTVAGSQFHGFTVNSSDSLNSVLVNSIGSGYSIDISPHSYDFGTRMIGTETPTTLTVTNKSAAPVSVSGVTLSAYESISTPTPDLSETDTCVGTLSANATCTIAVKFKPTVQGFKAYSVWVRTGESYQVHTNAWGTGYALSIAPPSFDFLTRPIGTKGTQVLTVINHAAAPVSINGIQLSAYGDVNTPASGDFSQTNTCGNSLGAGQQCTVAVSFAPSAVGFQSLSVWVQGNDTVQVRSNGWGTGSVPLH